MIASLIFKVSWLGMESAVGESAANYTGVIKCGILGKSLRTDNYLGARLSEIVLVHCTIHMLRLVLNYEILNEIA